MIYFSILKNISQVSGGSFFNLTEDSNLKEISSSIGCSPFSFLFAEFDENEITEVYPSRKKVIENESFNLNGILNGNEATIVLNFGFGNEITEKKKIKLTKREAYDLSAVLATSLREKWL